MVIEEIKFTTLKEAEAEKKNRQGVWRSLYTDFINDNIVVTFVNGPDDQNNSQQNQERKLKKQRKYVLSEKLRNDDNLSFEEINDFLRLQLIR